jgi:hypothetical protein
MLLVDDHFDSRGDDQPAADGAFAGAFDRREPSEDRASHPSPARARHLQQTQSLGAREARTEGHRYPALDEIAGQLRELACHRFESRAFHLAQLDRENLEQVAVGIDGRRPPPFGRAHETARHIEPDGALAGLRPGGGVDGNDSRCIQDAGGEGREITQPPRGEGAVFAERGERVRRGARGGACGQA